MSHIEREEAFTKGYESLVELHLQQEEQKKAKSQQPAATVEEQPPVLKASDYHLSKEQLNNLLALARAYGKHQKTICHLLIENWKDLRHGNFLEQVHQIYASEKTAVGHSRSDIHEIINRLATNWEELQDGRYVVFMNELNALCAPEDRDISREYGKLAVTLGKNWKFLKNEEHLSFLKYLRNSERLRGHYMRAIGGHKQGYDDPRRFYRGPLPTEEIVSIQAAFMSYFDLDEQDGVAFDTFEDSQFKGLKNLDPQYRKRFKELIKSLHQERREKLVYLAAYKDINKHFAFFEELVEHSKEKSQIAENASLLWDACHTKPERLPHAIKAITDIKPFDGTFHDRYIDALMGEGEAAAQAYHQATIKKAKGLNDPATAPALRSDEEYNWMVRYIYPDGNFSSYETNRQCEDHPEHLEGYEFDPEGYPIRLSGLLGYSVKEGKEENTGLLDSYKKRLHAVRNFIDTRHARNESLQTAFQKEVDEAFAKYAHPRFKTLEPITTPVETPPEGEHKLSDAVDNPRTGLTVKEKLLCLFITEVIRKIEASGRAQQDSERKEKMLTPEATEAVVILNDEIKSLLDELKDCSPERTTEINGTLRDLRAQKGSLEGRDVNENYELNTQILDLMVIYHYVFNEHLEPYIVRSADVVKAEQDPVAQNYLHWQELSNIYGENIKHALRHDFSGQSSSDLPQLGNITSTYKAIIQAAAASGIISQEQIKDRQKEAIVTNIIQNDKIPADRKYTVLCKKINQMVLGPLKLSKEEREELKAAVEETLKPFRSAPTVETLNQLIPSIYSLRAPYRVKFESKMEELFTHDINLINIEISKYKENSETDMKETRMGGEKHKAVTKSKKSRNIRGRYMKTRESANARMGAYLCIAGDKKMYEDPNYFEQVYFDEDTSECVGLTMHINIEAKDGKKYLWFGPNPFESFLDKVSARKCLEFQYQQVCQFADRNGYDGVVIPSAENRILGECTNRGGMFPDLIKQRRLREEDGKLKIVQFGGSHTIGRHGGSAYSYTDGALIWERAAA
jgi:hypothetical protein